MKKKANLLLWMIVLVFIVTALAGCSGTESTTFGQTDVNSTVSPVAVPAAVPEKIDTITVRASVPHNWFDGTVSLWAWKDGGEDAFEAWPGKELVPDDHGWFTATAPSWVDRIVISGFDGTVQTADLPIEAGCDIWVLVSNDLTAAISYEDSSSDYEYSAEDVYTDVPEEKTEENPEEAKVHTVNQAIFDVTLNEDGSANVVETWVVDFESGQFSRFRKEIYTDVPAKENFTGVQNVQVWIDGILCEESDTDGYKVEEQSDRVIISAYKKSKHIIRTYTFSYTLTDVVKKLDDTHSYFSYRFVGANHSVPIENLEVTINSPVKCVFSTDYASQGSEMMQDSLAVYTAQNTKGLYRVAVNLETDQAFGVPYSTSDDAGSDFFSSIFDFFSSIFIVIFTVLALFLNPLSLIIISLPISAYKKWHLEDQIEAARHHPERMPILLRTLEEVYTPSQILAHYWKNGGSIRIFTIIIAELIASGHIQLTEDQTGILLKREMDPPKHAHQQQCLALLDSVFNILKYTDSALPLAEFVDYIAQKSAVVESRFTSIRYALHQTSAKNMSPEHKKAFKDFLPYLHILERNPVSFVVLLESFRNKDNMTLRALDYICCTISDEESAPIDQLLVPMAYANTIWIDKPSTSNSDSGCSSCSSCGGCSGCGGCGGD